MGGGMTTDVQKLRAADPRVVSSDIGTLLLLELERSEGVEEQQFSPTRPVLAYHAGGLLILGGSYVVEDGGRVAHRRGTKAREGRTTVDVAAERARYRRDHWGQPGTYAARRLPAANPRLRSEAIAPIVAVTYRTKKGADRVLTDYRHPFKRPRPVLAWNPSGLFIAGGVYHVTERGIID